MQTCDVAVIDSGIVGAACAYELASSGLRVVVVETVSATSSQNQAGYGSMALSYRTPAEFALTRYGLELWNLLADWLPPECEYRRQGTLWLATDDEQMKDAIRHWDFLHRHGVEAEWLDHRQVVEEEPALHARVEGGLLVKADCSLQPQKAAEFLFQLAAQKGATKLGQQITNFEEHEVTLDDGSVLYCGNIVVSSELPAPASAPEISVQYSKGHLLVVETDDTCAQHQLSMLTDDGSTDASIQLQVRQSASQVWIGSSYQNVSEPVTSPVEPKVVAKLLRAAIQAIPSIGLARPSRSWTTIRALTSDNLPFIGRVAARDSIFAALGFGDHGATAALAAAKLIADELLCRPPQIDPRPYLADRFKEKST